MEEPEKNRYRIVLYSVFLSVCGSVLAAFWPGSDGRTAVALNLANLVLLSGYLWRTRDAALGRLLLFGVAFGVVELLADFLCIRMTRTLSYIPSRSPMLFESPFWMPSAWAVVALQTGFLGAWALRRLGWVRGLLLSALVGAIQIPVYEELAYYAHWWRYTNCRMLSHTPLYIITAEALIVMGIAPLAKRTLERPGWRLALWLGMLGGLVTVVAGMIGYGLCEFIPNGFSLRASPPAV
jgi:fluoride ion exporter CrcB/FEX